MALHLPTDTQHLALETRQYEIFGKSLGQGIPRRRVYVGAVACVLWWLLLAVLAVNPLTRLGPTLYLVPPFAVVFFGCRVGDDGRMRLMRWYDAALAWTPSRRRIIHNPLLPAVYRNAPVIRIAECIVELHPDYILAASPNRTRPERDSPGDFLNERAARRDRGRVMPHASAR